MLGRWTFLLTLGGAVMMERGMRTKVQQFKMVQIHWSTIPKDVPMTCSSTSRCAACLQP